MAVFLNIMFKIWKCKCKCKLKRVWAEWRCHRSTISGMVIKNGREAISIRFRMVCAILKLVLFSLWGPYRSHGRAFSLPILFCPYTFFVLFWISVGFYSLRIGFSILCAPPGRYALDTWWLSNMMCL
jgi:hypothetical protein